METQFGSDGLPRRIRHPRYLFRYVRADNNLVLALQEGYLWFSHPQNLNDSFDCQKLLDTDNTVAEIFEYISEYGGREQWTRQQRKQIAAAYAKDKKGHRDLINDAYQETLASVGICCFSEVSNHPLMWAHYANSHRGACLVFEFQRLGSERIGVPVGITYLESLPKYNYVRERISGRRSPPSARRFDEIVFGTKTSHWAYEKEIRFVSGQQGKVKFDPKALAGIIFGARIDQKIKAALVLHARALNGQIQFSDATIDLENNAIVVAGFENSVCEGDIVMFLDLAGLGRPSATIVRYGSRNP